MSAPPLPASEETLSGERQRQITSTFSDMVEAHAEPSQARPYLDLDRLDL
ncbi:MAG TPA: hypothetical protein HA286_05345 [Candidatus Poseidoniaceae archaeon]|nr:hypothetical protein [Candidatus Poseidoniaceae archaeon]